MLDSHDTMNALRAQYEGITPPAELSRRLESVMKPARRPAKRLWGRCFAHAVLAAALALAVAANVSAAAAETLAKIPVIGAFTRLVTFREYTDDRGGAEARIETPHAAGLGDAALEEALNAQFDQYGALLIEQYESDVKALGTQAHESVASTYEALVDNDRQLTVAIHTVIARASAQQINKYYTVDKQARKLVSLEDLFLPGSGYAAAISENILEQMRAQMRADEGKAYYTGDEPGAFSAIRPDQPFYISGAGKLVVSFDEYEAAPGYMGAVTFEIPTESIAGMIRPGGLLR